MVVYIDNIEEYRKKGFIYISHVYDTYFLSG